MCLLTCAFLLPQNTTSPHIKLYLLMADFLSAGGSCIKTFDPHPCQVFHESLVPSFLLSMFSGAK